MSNGDVYVPEYSQAVEDELKALTKTATGAPLFIIKVDEDGNADLLASPGRKYKRIGRQDPLPAVQLLQLACATWQVYQTNPRRSRNCIGGDCYDGG